LAGKDTAPKQGHVLKACDQDPKQQSRVYVHIPGIMYNCKKDEGIWCLDENNNIGTGESGATGSTDPLQVGEQVDVSFPNNDYNSGRAKRRGSSHRAFDLKTGGSTYFSSDDQKAGEHAANQRGSISPVSSDGSRVSTKVTTIDGPCKGSYNIYNQKGEGGSGGVGAGSSDSVTEEGYHTYTNAHWRLKAQSDINIEAEGRKTEYVRGDNKVDVDGSNFVQVQSQSVEFVKGDTIKSYNGTFNLNINNTSHEFKNGNNFDTVVGDIYKNYTGGLTESQNGSRTLKISGSFLIQVDGKLSLSAQEVNIKGKSGVNIDGPPIYLNSGKASVVGCPDAPPALINDVVPPGPVCVKGGSGAGADPSETMKTGPDAVGSGPGANCGKTTDLKSGTKQIPHKKAPVSYV
jgi:hypothetical protein